MQAYFAAGAVKGIAGACHDQKIRDCVCSLDGPVESTDEAGNLIYRDCKEDSKYSIDYVLNFIFPGLTINIVTKRYSVNFQIVKNADGSISMSIEKTALAAVDQPTTDPTTTDPTTTDPTADPESSEPYTRILNDVHNTVVGLKVREEGGRGREGGERRWEGGRGRGREGDRQTGQRERERVKYSELLCNQTRDQSKVVDCVYWVD